MNLAAMKTATFRVEYYNSFIRAWKLAGPRGNPKTFGSREAAERYAADFSELWGDPARVVEVE